MINPEINVKRVKRKKVSLINNNRKNTEKVIRQTVVLARYII